MDATTVDLQPNVNVVVGPNGCGKSNILDAIRWVIGESSAQRLRGEVTSDFIFDGSDARPPSSRASVELLFDNADGRVGGEYSSYGELSVRREVTTESQSHYYLNGQRCRRRDVQDVFLGTGFGTRGYSIVQQDLISQLVNSNPDTLRDHLEEAAGISKYRARRHETLNNINRTKLNLDQVRIALNELDREIRQLKRQATQARRYQKLEGQLNRLKRMLIDKQLTVKRSEHEELAETVADLDDQLLRLNNSISTNDSRLEELEKTRNEVQGSRDELASARIESNASVQMLDARIKEIATRRESNHANIESKLTQLRESLHLLDSDIGKEQQGKTSIQRYAERLEEVTEVLAKARKQLAQSDEMVEAAVSKNESLKERLREAQAQHDELTASRQIDEAAIESVRQLVTSPGTTESDVSEIERSITEFESLSAESSKSKESLDSELSQTARAIHETHEQRAELSDLISKLNSESQQVREKLLALKTLRDAALGETEIQQELKDWLIEHELTGNKRIGELIDVESGWERTVEMVLGTKIKSIVTDELESKLDSLGDLKHSDIQLYASAESKTAHTESSSLTSLSSKLTEESKSFSPLFRGVYTASSLDEALVVRQSLKDHESVVTADGSWVAKDWVWLFQATPDELGVIEQERHIEQLEAELAEIESESRKCADQYAEHSKHIAILTENRESLLVRLNDISTTHTEQSTLLKEFKKQLVEKRQVNESNERLRQERQSNITQLRQKIEDAEDRLVLLGEELTSISQAVSESEKITQAAIEEQRTQHHAFETAASNQREVEFELSRSTATNELVASAIERQDRVVSQLIGDLRILIEDDAQAKEAIPGLHQERSDKLDEVSELSENLGRVESKLSDTDSELERIRRSQTVFNETKDQLNDTRVDRTSQLNRLVVELEQLETEIKNLVIPESDSEDSTVDTDIEVSEVEQQIQTIEASLSRLGLINYRAHEELTDREENKAELDSQVEDLEKGLATLESSIKKIDEATIKSMRETFDATNANLDRVFRQLFGGGTASLELTDSDILLAGIQVKAQPPGKRNSTISMLSGGERAMTAIAFIFALFDLNPSPVCILDEVDAPLDERNVVKFTGLLGRMSTETQFVIITHNPATMELAGNLLGVTMEEAGVSRIVSVNLEDAYQMAANQPEVVAINST